MSKSKPRRAKQNMSKIKERPADCVIPRHGSIYKLSTFTKGNDSDPVLCSISWLIRTSTAQKWASALIAELIRSPGEKPQANNLGPAKVGLAKQGPRLTRFGPRSQVHSLSLNQNRGWGTWLGPRDTRREDVVKADSDSAKQNTDQIKQNTDQIKPANGRLYELKLSQSIWDPLWKTVFGWWSLVENCPRLTNCH